MITLDGYTLDYFGLIAQTGHENGLAPTVDRILPIALMDGAHDFGSDNGPRPFNLPLAWARELTRIELQSKIRIFTAFLYDSRGKARNIELRFDYESDKYYTVRYVGSVTPERLFSMAFFTLPLIAFDPYAYSNETNNEVTWGSQVITFNSDYLMGHEGGETVTIISNDSYNVVLSGFQSLRPTINLDGVGTNVTIQTNGKSFTIAALGGSAWGINGQRYQVSKDGSNALNEYSGDFLELFKGDNEVTITGSSMNFTLQVTFRDKYL